jgi:hypothetical protein
MRYVALLSGSPHDGTSVVAVTDLPRSVLPPVHTGGSGRQLNLAGELRPSDGRPVTPRLLRSVGGAHPFDTIP